MQNKVTYEVFKANKTQNELKRENSLYQTNLTKNINLEKKKFSED